MECLMNRLLVFPLACALLLTMACGKIDLPTSPTNISASCELTLNPAAMAAPPNGGSFYTGVAGPCAWDAESADSWISVTYGRGTGVGTVTYNVAENTGATAREGQVRIGGQVLLVTQAGVDCSVVVEPTAVSVPVAGGIFEIKIAIGPQCTWTASVGEPWLVLATSSGKGAQTVSLRVSENTGASPRNAQIVVADQTIAVHQTAPVAPPRAVTPSPPTPPAPPTAPAPPTTPAPPAQSCSYSLTPASQNVSVSGGSFQATVTAPGGCEWSAMTSESWISLGARGGLGSSRLSYSIQSNGGSERTGIVQIAGQVLRVTQAGCSYNVDPGSQRVTSKGGEFSIAVASGADCSWSASSTVPWISIGSGSGPGNGRVIYRIGANDGAARAGQIRIGPSSISVSQDPAPREVDLCSLSLGPATQNVSIEGGIFSIKVSVGPDCAWSVEKAPSWVSFRSKSGTGSAEVVYAVEKGGLAARTDAIVINGRAVTVSQAGLR